MRRAVLRVVWVTVVFVTFLTVLGCSDGRPTVEDIQGEFESLGFEFEVWDLRDIGVPDVSLRGVSPHSPIRRVIVLIEGQSQVEGVDWNSAELVFNYFGLLPYSVTDYERESEYINVLASLLTPGMEEQVLAWHFDTTASENAAKASSQHFGNVFVETTIDLTFDRVIITFTPDPEWK